VLRGRPLKHRANSAMAIRHTLWANTDGIGLTTITTAMTRPQPSIAARGGGDGPGLAHACRRLAWAGYTWAQGPGTCELEARLLHAGSTAIPPDIFQSVVRGLRANDSMAESTLPTSDYTCGSVRVSVDPDGGCTAVQKERVARTDYALVGGDPLGLRVALSYEHVPINGVWDRARVDAQFTQVRKKSRTRFVHRNTVAIDCTHVQTMGRDGVMQSTDQYEIEIEMLRDPRYDAMGPVDCDGIIMSMLWRMVYYVAGMDVESAWLAVPGVQQRATTKYTSST